MISADALYLGRHADFVLHVVRWNSTPRRAVLAALDRLRNFGIPVDGVILSRVHEKELWRLTGVAEKSQRKGWKDWKTRQATPKRGRAGSARGVRQGAEPGAPRADGGSTAAAEMPVRRSACGSLSYRVGLLLLLAGKRSYALFASCGSGFFFSHWAWWAVRACSSETTVSRMRPLARWLRSNSHGSQM